MVDLKVLVENNVHLGHRTYRWHPAMKEYIWGQKNGIHLIDISKTSRLLSRAGEFLESLAAEDKIILFVGTKNAGRDIVRRVATDLKMPYVINRWIGGTLTNYRQVKKSVANLLHYKDILKKTEQFPYNKKELSVIEKRESKLEEAVGGITNLTWPVSAVVVVDIKREAVAVKEAIAMGIPVIALVDTNSNPTGIDYVIPANDDSPRSINIILSSLEKYIQKGIEKAQEHKKEVQAEEANNLDLKKDQDKLKKPVKKIEPKVKVKPQGSKKAEVKAESKESKGKETISKAKSDDTSKKNAAKVKPQESKKAEPKDKGNSK